MSIGLQISRFFHGTWKFFLVLIVVLLILYGYIHYRLIYPATNDASVQANVVAITSRVSGVINEVHVQNNQYVKQGDLLFSLDPSGYQIALNKAQADVMAATENVKALKAQILADQSRLTQLKDVTDLALLEKSRQAELLKTNVTSQNAFDEALTDWQQKQAAYQRQQHLLAKDDATLGSLEANLKSAEALLSAAKLALSYTQITAPADGNISNFFLQVGNPITQFSPLFGLVKIDDSWVTANFLETELLNIRPGQKGEIRLLMYPTHVFEGVVESVGVGIAPDTQAQSVLLPYVKPTINWLRLAQRFPVRIKITEQNPDYPLRVGASARVTIQTND